MVVVGLFPNQWWTWIANPLAINGLYPCTGGTGSGLKITGYGRTCILVVVEAVVDIILSNLAGNGRGGGGGGACKVLVAK